MFVFFFFVFMHKSLRKRKGGAGGLPAIHKLPCQTATLRFRVGGFTKVSLQVRRLVKKFVMGFVQTVHNRKKPSNYGSNHQAWSATHDRLRHKAFFRTKNTFKIILRQKKVQLIQITA
jgi:hypothetical protein